MSDAVELEIQSLDGRARGVALREGKRFFIEGALPGERVRAAIERDEPNYAVGSVRTVLRASSQRVDPRCPHFGVCGGCVLQHADAAAQVAFKQRELEEALQRGGLRPARMLPPLRGPDWAYRHRARLALRFVPSRGGVLLGFHERKSSFVADIRVCHVLPAAVSDLLEPLHGLVAGLSIPHRIPQIEVAAGDGGAVVLVLRHLLPLGDGDLDQLRLFAARHGVAWWLQPGGPETAAPLGAAKDCAEGGEDGAMRDELVYGLPRFGLAMRFRPTDFIQSNLAANRSLVSRALDLLEAGPDDRVLDLFCGLGNFTLPLATQAKEVLGVEGSAGLLDRARRAAADNGLLARTRYACTDLFKVDAGWLRAQGRFDLMLLDPPREGARALAEALATLAPAERPRRIVYVSCNPSTLARDAAIMAHRGGYRLKACGLVNMFPHTAHVESVSVLE